MEICHLTTSQKSTYVLFPLKIRRRHHGGLRGGVQSSGVRRALKEGTPLLTTVENANTVATSFGPEFRAATCEEGFQRTEKARVLTSEKEMGYDDLELESNEDREGTRVTRNYFENLVRALENGLSDEGSNGAAFGKATTSKDAAGSSKGRSGRGKGTFQSNMSNKMNDDNHTKIIKIECI
ncbi:hypothetical protein JHK82_044749 [Glycine max]|nr:hypothetical protein JHK85_045717 [Glycine max]KAG5099697.1 hypothetical protein JHK82_044749 [Glycine max]